MRAGDIAENKDLWMKMFKETVFASWIKSHYSLSTGSLVSSDDFEVEVGNAD
jgi:hypothetical protein